MTFTQEWLADLVEVRYHGGCNDGWCAAFITKVLLARLGRPDRQLTPVVHGQPPADLTGRTLYVDYCPPREWLETQDPTNVGIIDHHQTNAANIGWWRERGGNVAFDVERSGARLAWDILTEAIGTDPAVISQFAPWTVRYVEDRDLWRWALPESKAVNAFLAGVPHDFDEWCRLGFDTTAPMEAQWGGAAVLNVISEYVQRTCEQGFLAEITYRGRSAEEDRQWIMPLVNASYQHSSEVADELIRSTGMDIAGYFFQRSDGLWQYGFRSNGPDCSTIANLFGGGGHRNAAGCQVAEQIHEWRASL